MKVKRILHIIGKMDRAGAETMLMNLYRTIDKNKFQFDFVVFSNQKGDFDDEIRSLGGNIYSIIESNSIKRMFALKKLLLLHPEYQIVHCHTLFSNAFHLLTAKMAHVPYRIAHSHNTSDNSKNKIISAFYQKISKIIIHKYTTHFVSCGKAAAKFLFPKKKDVLLLLNAVNTNYLSKIGEIEKDYINNEFNLNSDCLKIIQIGRLQDVKNHLFSIQIAKHLKNRKINFKMLFVGQGNLYDEIRNEIINQKLSKEILLLGVRSDIPQLMAGADVMIMPSKFEGFPVVLVESQSVGIPSLISDTISTEVNLNVGLIEFESLNSNIIDWANKLLLLKKKEKISPKIKLNRLVEQGFDIHSSTTYLIDFYNSMN